MCVRINLLKIKNYKMADKNNEVSITAVSYTHLDVYKRQVIYLVHRNLITDSNPIFLERYRCKTLSRLWTRNGLSALNRGKWCRHPPENLDTPAKKRILVLTILYFIIRCNGLFNYILKDIKIDKALKPKHTKYSLNTNWYLVTRAHAHTHTRYVKK